MSSPAPAALPVPRVYRSRPLCGPLPADLSGDLETVFQASIDADSDLARWRPVPRRLYTRRSWAREAVRRARLTERQS